MISKLYGWQNNIPSEHIRHPANCEFLLSKDNLIKNSNSSITYEDLLERIKNWSSDTKLQKLKKTVLKTPKSEDHKKKISNSLKEWNIKNKNNISINSLRHMENLLLTKGIIEASKELGITKKQYYDKLRYRRKICSNL